MLQGKFTNILKTDCTNKISKVMKTETQEQLKNIVESGIESYEGFSENIIDSLQTIVRANATSFADWINNNWYIPTGTDGMWKLDIEHIEYAGEIPKVNIFTTTELLTKFEAGEGEM